MNLIGIARTWRLVGAIAVLAAILSIGAIACGDDDDDDENGEPTAVETMDGETPEATDEAEPGIAGQLDITAMEFAFEGVPSTQPSGLTTVTLDNIGAEDHQAIIMKLNDGATMEQFQSALEADESGIQALALASGAGGVNVLLGGESGEVQHELTEGTHVMLCFVSSEDGIPHLAKGMLASFEVTAGEGTPSELPAPDSTMTLADFSFPDMAIATGDQTIQVVNSGAQNHEATIVKLEEGFTVDQLRSMFTEEEPTPAPGETPEDQGGPPPFTSAGGYGAVAPGDDGYLMINLEPGNYALLCFFPDPETGAPHAALGMVGSLTVQ